MSRRIKTNEGWRDDLKSGATKTGNAAKAVATSTKQVASDIKSGASTVAGVAKTGYNKTAGVVQSGVDKTSSAASAVKSGIDKVGSAVNNTVVNNTPSFSAGASNIGRGIAASKPFAALRAAFSNKSTADIQAKHKFMNKFLSHIDQAVASYLRSRPKPTVRESIELMTWRELDTLLESTISEVTKGASARGIKNRQNERRPPPMAPKATPSVPTTTPTAAPTVAQKDVPTPVKSVPPTPNKKSTPTQNVQSVVTQPDVPKEVPKVEPTVQQSSPQMFSNDVSEYVRSVMYKNVLAGLNKHQFAKSVDTIASKIGQMVEKNPKISSTSLRDEFMKLGEVAWAAASASGANGNYTTPQSSSNSIDYGGDGEIDDARLQKYKTNIDNDFKNNNDLDDLAALTKTAADKYTRLGGQAATLDKIIKTTPTTKTTKK